MNKKGAPETDLWVKISVAILVMVLLFIVTPKIFGQGLSDINSKFCLSVDTDGDGVSDSVELMEKTCVCNEDIPSKQFYVIDTDFVTSKKHPQQLFTTVPSRISYEDVTRIGKYIYELEAYEALNDNTKPAPQLILKETKIEIKSNPALSDFCFTKQSACTLDDFKEDFFVKDSTYTYKTVCAIENDGDACKKLREGACAKKIAESKNADKQEKQP